MGWKEDGSSLWIEILHYHDSGETYRIDHILWYQFLQYDFLPYKRNCMINTRNILYLAIPRVSILWIIVRPKRNPRLDDKNISTMARHTPSRLKSRVSFYHNFFVSLLSLEAFDHTSPTSDNSSSFESSEEHVPLYCLLLLVLFFDESTMSVRLDHIFDPSNSTDLRGHSSIHGDTLLPLPWIFFLWLTCHHSLIFLLPHF